MTSDQPAAANSGLDVVVHAERLAKSFADGDGAPRSALNDVSLEIRAGELVAVIGPSGSGKSTLLHLLGGLDTPDSGVLRVAGTALHDLNEATRTRFRHDTVGFIFQAFYLVPSMTVIENVALSAIIADQPRKRWDERAWDVLADLDLVELADRWPSSLSGGQQQRVAIGRAIFSRPPVLLADEPTGNLDSANSEAVLDLLREAVNSESRTCGVLVTHDMEAAAWCDRVIVLRDGAVADELVLDGKRLPSGERREPTEHVDRIRSWLATSPS